MILPVRETEESALSCPYCEALLTELIAIRVQAKSGKRYAYGCPSCSRLLSVWHRKGFWMG